MREGRVECKVIVPSGTQQVCLCVKVLPSSPAHQGERGHRPGEFCTPSAGSSCDC